MTTPSSDKSTTNADAAYAVDRIKRCIVEASKIGAMGPAFEKWHRSTRLALRSVFGVNSTHQHEFSAIDYTPMSFSMIDVQANRAAMAREFVSGMRSAIALLESFVDEISEYGLSSPATASATSSSVDFLTSLFRKFPLVVRELNRRHNKRTPLTVSDEYDVQDLVRALLRLRFSDIRSEEHTASHAGGSARMDFLLKKERVVVEIKFMNESMTSKTVCDQLLEDIGRYHAHADCGTLFCFVYDPNMRLVNPAGLERDLSRKEGSMEVIAIIAPQDVG